MGSLRDATEIAVERGTERESSVILHIVHYVPHDGGHRSSNCYLLETLVDISGMNLPHDFSAFLRSTR
jgi:hypothetical protein